MLKKLLFLFSIYYCSEKKGHLNLSGGRLLIYTDTKIENLSIFHKNKNLEEVLEVKDVTYNYNPEDFLFKSYIYSFKLPDDENGEICCEIKDDDNNLLLKINSSFKREKLDLNKVFFETPWTNEIRDKNNEPYAFEASFTYIFNKNVKEVTIVIGENIDKKVKLDKSLEYHIIKKISSVSKRCERFLMDLFEDLRFLRTNSVFLNEHIEVVNNFMYGLIYQVTHL